MKISLCARVLSTVASWLLWSACTEQFRSETEQTRRGVINGVVSSHPSVVRLEFDTGGSCTGSIIAPNVVLTAEHCIRGMQPHQIEVEVDRFPCGRGLRLHWATPQTPACGEPLRCTDLALVTVDRDMTTCGGVAIEWAKLEPAIMEGTVGTIIGFGKTGDAYDALSGTEHSAEMSYEGRREGRLVFYDEETGVCYGDSGGPVIVDGTVFGVAALLDGPVAQNGTKARCSDFNTRSEFCPTWEHAQLIEAALYQAREFPDSSECDRLEQRPNGYDWFEDTCQFCEPFTNQIIERRCLGSCEWSCREEPSPSCAGRTGYLACAGSTMHYCTPDGQFAQHDCATESKECCEGGCCVPMGGVVSCAGPAGGAAICDSDGYERKCKEGSTCQFDACASGAYACCPAFSVSPECEIIGGGIRYNAGLSCVEGGLRRCNHQGVVEVVVCPSQHQCAEADGRIDCFPSAASEMCPEEAMCTVLGCHEDGRSVLYCDENRHAFTSPCPADHVCDQEEDGSTATCVRGVEDAECEPEVARNTFTCSANELHWCTPEGRWSRTPCHAGTTCVAELGRCIADLCLTADRKTIAAGYVGCSPEVGARKMAQARLYCNAEGNLEEHACDANISLDGEGHSRCKVVNDQPSCLDDAPDDRCTCAGLPAKELPKPVRCLDFSRFAYCDANKVVKTRECGPRERCHEVDGVPSCVADCSLGDCEVEFATTATTVEEWGAEPEVLPERSIPIMFGPTSETIMSPISPLPPPFISLPTAAPEI